MYPNGQFCKNTVYLERGMPYSAFMYTNAVLVRNFDKSQMNIKKLPCAMYSKTTARFEPWLINNYNNYYDGIVITIPGTISVIT